MPCCEIVSGVIWQAWCAMLRTVGNVCIGKLDPGTHSFRLIEVTHALSSKARARDQQAASVLLNQEGAIACVYMCTKYV